MRRFVNPKMKHVSDMHPKKLDTFGGAYFYGQNRKKKNKTYSTEFKVNVIMDMREHHMGYRETARKYSLV